MRVLITGATGFVGRHLGNHLERHGHVVTVVSRRPNVGYDWSPESLAEGVGKCDAVVHLAGAGVLDKRWTAARRQEIVRSRTETTRAVAEACARAERRLISTSAVGYYGTATMERAFDEQDGPGDDFLAEVCSQWEQALEPATGAQSSVAVVRVGVVLGLDGGALKRMLLPFKLCLGGPIGLGRQPFPWIHIEDLVRLYTWLLMNPEQQGAFNAVAPGACTQGTFARTLGRVLLRPAFLPTPGFALHLALGPGAELLTHGQHVLPTRAMSGGFTFEHGHLKPALANLLAR